MKLLLSALLCLGLMSSAVAQNQSPRVLASVHPLALVAASVVEPDSLEVLLPKGMTPHDFSLRPSDIDRIQSADIILWAGAVAEPYLAGFVDRWPEKQWLDVSLGKTASTIKDPHWWFSTELMIDAQQQLARMLKLPSNDFEQQVNKAVEQAQLQLALVQHRGFLVFHQAYDHWVEAMQLNQIGAFTISPELKPGAKTIQRMRKQLSKGEVVCVFSEPEFSPNIVETVTRGIDIQRGELDPMAYNIPLQADGYLLFINDLTQRFVSCLTEQEIKN